MMSSEVV